MGGRGGGGGGRGYKHALKKALVSHTYIHVYRTSACNVYMYMLASFILLNENSYVPGSHSPKLTRNKGVFSGQARTHADPF